MCHAHAPSLLHTQIKIILSCYNHIRAGMHTQMMPCIGQIYTDNSSVMMWSRSFDQAAAASRHQAQCAQPWFELNGATIKLTTKEESRKGRIQFIHLIYVGERMIF